MFPFKIVAAGNDAAPSVPRFLPEWLVLCGLHPAVNQRLTAFVRISESPDHGKDGKVMGVIRRDHRSNVRGTDLTFCFQWPSQFCGHLIPQGRAQCPVHIGLQLRREFHVISCAHSSKLPSVFRISLNRAISINNISPNPSSYYINDS